MGIALRLLKDDEWISPYSSGAPTLSTPTGCSHSRIGARSRRCCARAASSWGGWSRPRARSKRCEAAAEAPAAFLLRHRHGDWGELDTFDREENDLALRCGGRLLSAYRTRLGEQLWVITEADRSATTLLLPEE